MGIKKILIVSGIGISNDLLGMLDFAVKDALHGCILMTSESVIVMTEGQYKGQEMSKESDKQFVTAVTKFRNEEEPRSKAPSSDVEDAKRYRWLKAQPMLSLKSDNMGWTRLDGTKYISSHRLAARTISFESFETLDETIDHAMAYFDKPKEDR